MTSPASFRWGIIFIGVGVIWLLVSNDVIHWSVWGYLLSLWPFLLIALGLEMIFKRTKLHALAYVSPLILVIVAGLAAREAYLDEQEGSSLRASFLHEPSKSVQRINASVNLGDYDLYMRGSADKSVRGHVNSGGHPDVKYEEQGEQANLNVNIKDSWFDWNRIGFPFNVRFDSDYHRSYRRHPELKMYVPSVEPVSLELSGNESRAELSMADVELQNLVAKINKVALSLDIGSKIPSVDVNITGSRNSLVLGLPEGGGVRIEGGGLMSDLTSLGLEKIGEFFMTPGYDTLTPKVNVKVDGDLDRLRLKTY